MNPEKRPPQSENERYSPSLAQAVYRTAFIVLYLSIRITQIFTEAGIGVNVTKMAQKMAREIAFGDRTNAQGSTYQRLKRRPKRHPPPLKGLVKFADLFGLDTRKKIKAMAGDYAVEIRRLRRERRYFTAKWNCFLAWGYALWFAVWTPLERITTTVVKMLKGS